MSVIYTTSRREDVENVLRNLPAMLAGEHPDTHRIAESLRSRVAHAFFSQVAFAFEEKGRGRVGSDGIKWEPLSPEYLAYQRPKVGRGRPLAGKLAPGGNDGLLTKSQLKTWNANFARSLKWLAAKYPLTEAKSRAAALAWKATKAAGGRTKIADPGFGGRIAGDDYQMLVSGGTLRRSILPGEIDQYSNGGADYHADDDGQVVDDRQTSIVVGTRVPYAEYLHKRRPLWPEDFTPDWIDQMNDAIVSGIYMFVLLTEQGEI